jgi:TfoX/Sxy family transcriptional regulator of competence genes
LRLGKAEREAFLADFDSELLVTYGTVMKEYVAVPDQLLQDTAGLLPYLELSLAYAKTLKPQARKRKG